MIFQLPEEIKWMVEMIFSSSLLPGSDLSNMCSGIVEDTYSNHIKQPSIGTVSECNPIYSVVVVCLF